MRILAYNGGHDGSAVIIEDGRLSYCIEAEKDGGRRHAFLTPSVFLNSLALTGVPDVVAVSGWVHGGERHDSTIEAGYNGIDGNAKTEALSRFCGHPVRRFSSSHERSHVLCSYGLSPFPQGQPCYALVWEGGLGDFYYVDEKVCIQKIGTVMKQPGSKYAFLYGLADPTFPRHEPGVRLEDAGKLMALAAYGRSGPATARENAVIEQVMKLPNVFKGQFKGTLSESGYCDIGVESQEFKDLARYFTEAMFDQFHRFAVEHLTRRLPLVISGGCGLNCDWNSQWRECGLFEDVFVPPCTNDSGVALGAAIDALHHYTGRAKIEWDVYAGEKFVEDEAAADDFECAPLNLSQLCAELVGGAVFAWVQGRYEMGPRALGNRSLIAAPFSARTLAKLNKIKQREGFRPIAPLCLEEEMHRHFDPPRPSPHMLYFQRVINPQLRAVTHVDGSARAQSVNDLENPEMCALLREFRKHSGVGVLCNTSLNFKGEGFLNRMSHLTAYARAHGLDGFVVGQRWWHLKRKATAPKSFDAEALQPLEVLA